jgi:hypothetical protein
MKHIHSNAVMCECRIHGGVVSVFYCVVLYNNVLHFIISGPYVLRVIEIYTKLWDMSFLNLTFPLYFILVVIWYPYKEVLEELFVRKWCVCGAYFM